MNTKSYQRYDSGSNSGSIMAYIHNKSYGDNEISTLYMLNGFGKIMKFNALCVICIFYHFSTMRFRMQLKSPLWFLFGSMDK